jgi:hypothetical protein
MSFAAANSLVVAHSSLAWELIGFHRTAARLACEIFGVVQFSTFATKSANSRHHTLEIREAVN